MEISSIEAPTNAKVEVDRALDTANKTFYRLLEEIPFESETGHKRRRTQQHQRQASESTMRCTRARPTPRLKAASGC